MVYNHGKSLRNRNACTEKDEINEMKLEGTNQRIVDWLVVWSCRGDKNEKKKEEKTSSMPFGVRKTILGITYLAHGARDKCK